jgi:hypothetical protein
MRPFEKMLKPARQLLVRHILPALVVLFCLPFAAHAATAPSVWATNWTMADFDGDHKPDLARGRSVAHQGDHVYQVSLELTAGNRITSFTFRNPSELELEISAIDVDGDNDLDLVVSGRYFGQRIGVWINDGTGSFSESPSIFWPNYFEKTSVSSSDPDSTNPAAETKSPRVWAELYTAGIPRISLLPCEPSHDLPAARVLRPLAGALHLRAPPADARS